MHAYSAQRTVGVELILLSVTLVLRLVGLVDDSCIVDTLRTGANASGDSDSPLPLLDETAAGVIVVSWPTVDFRPLLYLVLLLLPHVWFDTAIKLGVAATTIDLGSSSCVYTSSTEV
jgi:hypothetical protein